MKNLTLSIFILTALPTIAFANTPVRTAIKSAQRSMMPSSVPPSGPVTLTAPRPSFTPVLPNSLLGPQQNSSLLGMSRIEPVAAEYVSGDGLELTNAAGDQVDLSGINSINQNMFYQIKTLQQSPMTIDFLKKFPELESAIATRFDSEVKANKVEDALGAAYILSQTEEWDPETKDQLRAMQARYANPAIAIDEGEVDELITNCTMP